MQRAIVRLSIIIIKYLGSDKFLGHWNIHIFSFFILSTSLDLFCNFQKTFETFEKTERCTQFLIFNF